MAYAPSRIELLELDVDLRVAELWKQLDELAFDRHMSEEQIEFVADFMRAAYGKGYCDALTEESPGSLCYEHGYKVPSRRPAIMPNH